MARIRNVALALNLSWPARWAYETFVGVQKYAAECGNWRWTIDQFPQACLPAVRRRSMPYDGVICRVTRALATRARRLRLPLVNTWFNTSVRNVPSVLPDYEAAGVLQAEHLLSRGFRRFGYFVGDNPAHQQSQYRGFSRCVEKAGCCCDIAHHPFDWDKDAGQWGRMRRSILRWLKSMTPPEAVHIDRPVIARLVATICHDLGLNVPQDVAIFCGIDDPIICEHVSPGLTSIDYNYKRQGYEAAWLLDQMMSGKPAPKQPILIPPAGIIQRASTDFFAVENDLVARALRYIAANIHKPLNVQDLVEATAVSRSTLQLAFRKHLGVPMSAEIMRLRLEKAKRMLAEPDARTLKQVAFESGLRNSKELCRIFRRELGITPGQYRKKVLGKKKDPPAPSVGL